ncbi:MAG: hypothetical protein A2506_08780 [Elusimicrobia bacterium RIFOXYD12_FULL_66_9]|nr:MAG: hypothetical protein A2506_08780 [Elusimicrobia bacterium RIFOXYD12_FULL_66_9]
MKMRILVVDDEPSTNTLAAEYLRLAGFEVVAVGDAQSALDALAAGLETHLIVVDRRLPDIDGLELCIRIKADPRLRAVPVLIVSAYGTPPTEFLEKVKPEGWMAKPFRPKQLAAEVSRLLGLRSA